MIHPHLTPVPRMLRASGLALHSNLAPFIDNSEAAPQKTYYESAHAAEVCCAIPIWVSEPQPAKHLTEPFGEVVVEMTLI